jgi:Flp pilus assembly pilin Flp
MKNSMFDGRLRQLGQGMTEYIIIVALIAVAAIGTFKFFGQTIRNQVAGLAAEVSGQSGAEAQAKAATAADSAETEAAKNKNLSNYYDGNQ